MFRLVVAAFALAPLALVTSAYAQTAPDDVIKTLWCGEAFAVLNESEKSQVTPDIQADYDAFVAASAKLIAKGTQGYLDAGFTEEQVTKVKADLVAEVTPIVTGNGQQTGRFSSDDCNPVLHAVLVLPPSSAAPAPASSGASDASMPAPAPSSEASSAAPAPASSAAASSAAQ